MNLKVAPASVEVKMIPPGWFTTGTSAVRITCRFKSFTEHKERQKDSNFECRPPQPLPRCGLTELPGPTLTPNSSLMKVLLIRWEMSWKDFA